MRRQTGATAARIDNSLGGTYPAMIESSEFVRTSLDQQVARRVPRTTTFDGTREHATAADREAQTVEVPNYPTQVLAAPWTPPVASTVILQEWDGYVLS